MKMNHRSSSWSIIVSGVLGFIAYGFLMYAVIGRGTGALTQSGYMMMFNLHDAIAMFQFLLLIPVVFLFRSLSLHGDKSMNKLTFLTGVISISLTAFTLLLAPPGVLSNALYTFPQGIFGGWLILVNWQMAGSFPRVLRWFGMIVGFGLVIFGSFLVGYTIFVDPINLRVPAASIEEFESIPFTPANIFLHQLIWVGSLMGVLPFPLWTILTGTRLLRTKSTVVPT